MVAVLRCRSAAREKKEARTLAGRLSSERITHVQSSPREPALRTAAPIAAQFGLEVEKVAALDEFDFGKWSGRKFVELNVDARWREWSASRSLGSPSGGESLMQAQQRVVRHLRQVDAAVPGACLVMVTHAEIIRAVALYCLSRTLNGWHAMVVAPGSVTTIGLRAGVLSLMRFNEKIAA